MKKILFIAFAVVGFSSVGAAQEAAVAAKRVPVLDQKAIDKGNKDKREAAPKNRTVLASTTAPKPTDNNLTSYKKAGLTDQQIAAMVPSINNLNKRKADIESNTQLTPDQKKRALEAIETEKAAVMKKSMGTDAYKKYNDQQVSQKTKATKTPKAAN